MSPEQRPHRPKNAAKKKKEKMLLYSNIQKGNITFTRNVVRMVYVAECLSALPLVHSTKTIYMKSGQGQKNKRKTENKDYNCIAILSFRLLLSYQYP